VIAIVQAAISTARAQRLMQVLGVDALITILLAAGLVSFALQYNTTENTELHGIGDKG
jgi:hypothetical protein